MLTKRPGKLNFPEEAVERIKRPALKKVLQKMTSDSYKVFSQPPYHCESMYTPITPPK